MTDSTSDNLTQPVSRAPGNEKLSMLRFYLRERRTLWLFLADVLILAGVLHLGWDPNRMILFFGFDLGLCVLSFIAYHIVLRGYEFIPNGLTVSMMILIPMYFILRSILTPPYIDFSIFLVFAVLAHIYDVKKYLRYKKSIAMPGFALYIGLVFFLIPILYALSKVFEFAGMPVHLALALSFILVRNFSEYRRYRKFIEIEREMGRETELKQ